MSLEQFKQQSVSAKRKLVGNLIKTIESAASGASPVQKSAAKELIADLRKLIGGSR